MGKKSGCKDCSLHSKCSNSYVIGRGSRYTKTEVMVVQDAPTYLDDRSGESLQGDTRKKLNYFLEKAGIDFKNVYFTSALKCRPGKNLSNIKKKHVNECRKFLLAEIVHHKPKVIIAMGRYSWEAVSGNTSIREFRGHFDKMEFDYETEIGKKTIINTFKCRLMPTLALSGSLRMWEWNAPILSDMKKVSKYLKTGKIDRTPNPVVNTITTLEGLNEFVERYKKVTLATTDFETTGFDFWRHDIISAGYCHEVGKADVIFVKPWTKKHTEKWTKKEMKRGLEINAFVKKYQKEIWEALKTVNAYKHLRLILQNGKFDSKFARYNKVPYRNFYADTLLADPLINENFGHALNIACERRGINFGAYDTKLWKYTNKDEKKKKSYQYIPPPMHEMYLGIDVDACMRLWKIQEVELEREGMTSHFFNRKMHTLRDVERSEYVGVKFNKPLILKASALVSGKQKILQAKLDKLTGIIDFNPNSPKQIIDYMVENEYPFERLQIKKTATGGYSTGAEELNKFLRYKKYKDFPQLVLNCKKLSKIKGTYIDGKDGDGGMIKHLDQRHRVHANFNLWSPRTSRESCNNPSLQVWPRPIKGMPNTRNFVEPTNPNWGLFEADYSQIEQCVVASLSKDRVLVDRIQKGMDLHCINASDLGHKLNTVPSWVSYEHMLVTNDKGGHLDPKFVKQLLRQVELDGKGIDFHEKRTQAKTVGFGLNYGKGKQSFAKEFGITEDEAEEMIDAYFDIYSEMLDWRNKIVYQALNTGYITLQSGRKRRFLSAIDWLNHDLAEGIWSVGLLKEEIGRQAMNAPVQGGAHEIFEPALIRLNRRFRKEKMQARLLLRIHDGIVGESPLEERPMVKQCINEEMPWTLDKGTKTEINLKVDVDFYKSCWYGEKIKI